MVRDHGSAFEELKLLAGRKGKKVSKTLPPKLQAVIDRLGRLNGAGFDAAYVKAQKTAHAETAMKMRMEIQNGHDSDVKGYAINTLPAVQMHAKMLMTRPAMVTPRMNHKM
jgi:putative membrane protein